MASHSFDLNVCKESSDSDLVTQYGGNPKVPSVYVVDIDEFCLHGLKDMVVKLGYGVANLMYYTFFRPRLSLDYGLHPVTFDADVLELAKYVKDNKIILVYVEHRSTNVESIFTTPKKGVALAVNNYSKALSISEVMTKFSKKPPASSDKGPIIVETDPFEDLDEILGDYANTRKEITGKEKIVHVDNSSTIENVIDCEIDVVGCNVEVLQPS
ncbi:hypothetical protein Tco_0852103 [Tanacetum coccineum]